MASSAEKSGPEIESETSVIRRRGTTHWSAQFGKFLPITNCFTRTEPCLTKFQVFVEMQLPRKAGFVLNGLQRNTTISIFKSSTLINIDLSSNRPFVWKCHLGPRKQSSVV
jgi:hypothetical protein